MDVDFSGPVGELSTLPVGTLFFARSRAYTGLGMTAVYRDGSANLPSAILFNEFHDGHSPCLVTGGYLNGVDLAALPDGFLSLGLAPDQLQFSSDQAEGPGMLILTAGGEVWIRLLIVSSKTDFMYANLGSGTATRRYPNGLEIPRWSIGQRGVNGKPHRVLFEFDGPKPI